MVYGMIAFSFAVGRDERLLRGGAELPWQSVRAFVQPSIELFRDAVPLDKDRERLDPSAFGGADRRRFDDLMLRTRSSRLRLRWHARGHQSAPAPGAVSISPTCPTTLTPPARRDYTDCARGSRLTSCQF